MQRESDHSEIKLKILALEKQKFIGGDVNLTKKEKQVNEIILREKGLELKTAHDDSSGFLPSKHFLNAKHGIDKSKVFKIIKKLPKGASLHTHFLAGVSTNFLLHNISRKENLYGRFMNDVFKLKFFTNPEPEWKSLEKYRSDNHDFDDWLKRQFSLVVEDSDVVFSKPEVVWKHLKKTFSTKYDMVSHKQTFKEYIHQFLKELYADNVVYAEIKGTIHALYDLNGRTYSTKDFFEIFIETVVEFKNKYPKFLGARYIHSIYRGVTKGVMESSLREIIEMKKLFPDFIAGFDLVGCEEEGNTLEYYYDCIKEATEHLPLLVHAGETSWYGHTDLNMIDAVLLNATRIGHAFGLQKHPVLATMVKDKNIAIELCPISNQMLMLNQDPRNHPILPFLVEGFPVVICNDDPSLWDATGLSYDWYIVFMAMTPEDAGIEVLKQLAINSIAYSIMKESEKENAVKSWNEDWKEFLDEIIHLDRLGRL